MARSGTAGGMAEMAFLDHLEELRQRLFRCAAAFALGAVIAFILFTQLPNFDVIEFLSRPITPYLHGQKLVYLHPGDAFQIVLDAGFALSFIIASPVILYQLWGFVSPAMYSHEKKLVLPVLGGIVMLFIAGVAMAFTVILPMTIHFLVGVESRALQPMIAASEYFGFAIYMCLAFGAAFELPIVIMGLTAIGLTNPTFLAKYRRYAAVGGLIIGSFITPDPTAMFAIAVPMYGLFELSIVLSRMVYRWRRKHEAGSEPPSIDPPSNLPPPPPMREEPRRLGATA
ncbi:MAG: twin-arginine translocase subunit TatC [Gemmatimonadota bacterium]|nr:twin-arginine translocase subunit TatC [Gemmatimonadota bacterium]